MMHNMAYLPLLDTMHYVFGAWCIIFGNGFMHIAFKDNGDRKDKIIIYKIIRSIYFALYQ